MRHSLFNMIYVSFYLQSGFTFYIRGYCDLGGKSLVLYWLSSFYSNVAHAYNQYIVIYKMKLVELDTLIFVNTMLFFYFYFILS